MAKLKESTRKVFDYVRENDKGDGVKMEDIAAALYPELDIKAAVRKIGPCVYTALKEKKDGSRPALVTYEKRMVAGEEKPVGYAHITEAGKVYEDTEDEVAE